MSLALLLGCASLYRTGWEVSAGQETDFDAARQRCARSSPSLPSIDLCLHAAGWSHEDRLLGPPEWAFRSYWHGPDKEADDWRYCLGGLGSGAAPEATVACLGARGWDPVGGWDFAVSSSLGCRWRFGSCQLAAEFADGYWDSERTPAELHRRR